MRKILPIVVAILGVLAPSPAQNNDEIAQLRTILRVPDTVPIAPLAKTPQLPSERPLIVYIDTAGDARVLNEVLKQIQEINKKQAEKYGPIEVTAEAAKASLWLIHFEVHGTRRKDADTSNDMAGGPGRGQTQNVIKAEVRGYVIARKPDGLEILSRYKKEVTLGDPRPELRDAFYKLLKDQNKTEKH